MADPVRHVELHDLLKWWPRPEPDPALFILIDLVRDDPRALRELGRVQLELSKEIHAAQLKAIDKAVGLMGQTK
jgi:hypothetical protein